MQWQQLEYVQMNSVVQSYRMLHNQWYASGHQGPNISRTIPLLALEGRVQVALQGLCTYFLLFLVFINGHVAWFHVLAGRVASPGCYCWINKILKQLIVGNDRHVPSVIAPENTTIILYQYTTLLLGGFAVPFIQVFHLVRHWGRNKTIVSKFGQKGENSNLHNKHMLDKKCSPLGPFCSLGTGRVTRKKEVRSPVTEVLTRTSSLSLSKRSTERQFPSPLHEISQSSQQYSSSGVSKATSLLTVTTYGLTVELWMSIQSLFLMGALCFQVFIYLHSKHCWR